MHAAVALDLGERLQPRRQFVADAADAAILVEVAVVVAGGGAVGERRVLVDGAVDGAAGEKSQPVEILVDAEGAAERRIDRISGEAGLDVRAAGIVGGDQQPQFRGEMGVLVTSRRPSIWPVKSGRSILVGAGETAPSMIGGRLLP